jgi:hypothetical protein
LDFGGLCHVQLMEAVVANVEPLGEEEIEAAGVEAEMGQWGAPEEWSVVYHSLVVVEKVRRSIHPALSGGRAFAFRALAAAHAHAQP